MRPDQRRHARWLPALLVLLLSAAGLLSAATPGHAAEGDLIVDLKTNISGPATALPKEAFTYTVTVGNNGLSDAAGATVQVQLPAGVTGLQAVCAASAGAECPTDLAVGASGATATVPVLPYLGQLVFTLTGNFAASTPSSVTATSTVTAAASAVESDPSTNTASISTVINVKVDVSTSIVAENTEVQMGQPGRYRAVFANAGPAPADGAVMRFDTVRGSAKVVSCVGTGMECPAHIRDATVGANGQLWTSTLESFPAGASFEIVYEMIREDGCGPVTHFAKTQVSAPGGLVDQNLGNNQMEAAAIKIVQPDCPAKAVLKLQKTQQRTTLTPGASTNTYTITIRNEGAVAAENVNFVDELSTFSPIPVSGASVRILTCDFGALPCPKEIVDTTLNLSQSGGWTRLWWAKIASFPAGATLTVTYELSTTLSDCGSGSLMNSAQVNAPGLSSSASQNVSASVNAGVCPQADLAATISASQPRFTNDAPMTYTATYTNRGPADADGAIIELGSRTGQDLAVVSQVTSCTTEGGAECPGLDLTARAGNMEPYRTIAVIPDKVAVPVFPPGSSVTITFVVEPVLSVCADRTVEFAAVVTAPKSRTETVTTDNRASVKSVLGCADLSINMTIAPTVVLPGEPVEFTIRISNSGSTAVGNARFELPLPKGFVFDSAECVAAAGSTCGDVILDEGSRTVSSVLPTLGKDHESVVITIRGTAGLVMATYASTASIESGAGVDAVYDLNPTSNRTTQPYQVFNTRSEVEITKTVEGFGDEGAPIDLTFSGSIVCETQGTIPWTLTVPAGSSSAALPPITLWDRDDCVVIEDPVAFTLDPWISIGDAELENADLATRDAEGDAQVASVSRVTIIPGPVATDDAAETEFGVPVEIPLVGNDTGNVISVTEVGTSPDGEVVLGEDGQVQFTPNPGFSGTTTFTYTISDQFGREATATVTVIVAPAPEVPEDPETPTVPETPIDPELPTDPETPQEPKIAEPVDPGSGEQAETEQVTAQRASTQQVATQHAATLAQTGSTAARWTLGATILAAGALCLLLRRRRAGSHRQ